VRDSIVIPRFPLQWPADWRRTPPQGRKDASFGKRERGEGYRPLKNLSVADGVGRVLHELDTMGVRAEDVVISTNIVLRLDGLPRSNQPAPGDPGVAVYWRRKDRTQCMAVDAYTTVADNLAAVAASLSAMRALERHGGAMVLERAFIGFQALPAPAGSDWRSLLGFGASEVVTYTDVDRRFKERITGKHPDQGGDPEVFQRLVAARDAAATELVADWQA
jgi:hypothetical protein